QEYVLGNPHSTNPTSLVSTTHIEATRRAVLDFFNEGDDYLCVFTANATQALKIVGESYPFDHKSHFLLLFDNHNSVNGIREYAKGKGATFEYCPVYLEDLRIDEPKLRQLLTGSKHKTHKLFAYPAQSNVSGVQHDLGWIATAQSQGWDVLLDAAAFVPTNTLDLQKVQPDYVPVSFYKIFGYPTGVGALLIRKSAFQKLDKPWFAGGTVAYASVTMPEYFLTDNQERFEEGTLNYASILAVMIGLEWIQHLGPLDIRARVKEITGYLLKELQALVHSNGRPLIHIFGPTGLDRRGSTLIMNFFDQNEEKMDVGMIEQEANRQKISIRSGCFCNPGIDEITNCITSEELSQFYSTRQDVHYDKVHFLGKMRGAIRVSTGLMTNFQDADYYLNFCRGFLQ
ncbi:MAG: aminotransferase class V-fold PLP-dependent enzyme, partial [Bacteroidota bacterium]|nr:aminotransferase class V-fold PLP-dependent enzyme [Bacteroidota bacterium]